MTRSGIGQETFREIVEGFGEGIAVLDAGGELLYANQTLCSLLGRDGYQGLSVRDLLGDEGAASSLLADGSASAAQRVLRLRKKDGEVLNAVVTVAPLQAPGSDGARRILCVRPPEVNKPSTPLTKEDHFRAVIDSLPAIVYIKDLDKRYVHVNPFAAGLMNMKPEKIVGKLDTDLFPEAVIQQWRKREDHVQKTGTPYNSEDVFDSPQGPRTFLASVVPIFDESGEVSGFGGISTDVTELRRAEEERARLRERVIEAQKTALQELSNPIIPVTDDVVAMPLVGAVDTGRAQQIVTALLERVAAHSVDIVIIDLTGVMVVDSAVARTLIEASDAVRLIGAQVVLTGIAPEVAQTMVKLGLQLDRFLIRATLKDGIAYGLSRNRKEGR